MIIRLFIISFVSLYFSMSAFAEDYAMEVLSSKVDGYEKKLSYCKKSENERELPSDDVFVKLSRYGDQELREFLVTSSSIALIRCTMPELGELSFFVGAILKNKNTSDESKEEAKYISALIHEISWSNYDINNKLSNEIKSEIEKVDYFKYPFNPFSILHKLNIL